MSAINSGFKYSLPAELAQHFSAALYACRFLYPGNDTEHLARLLKRHFCLTGNNTVNINRCHYTVAFFAKGNNYCLMLTGLTGNPILYDLDANEINTYFNSTFKET